MEVRMSLDSNNFAISKRGLSAFISGIFRRSYENWACKPGKAE